MDRLDMNRPAPLITCKDCKYGHMTIDTEEEVTRWAHVIHDAITGKWVTIWCRDVRACKSDFHDCLSVIKSMGLWYRARCYVGRYEIVIGESIRDGGIDFRTPDMDRRRAGDPR